MLIKEIKGVVKAKSNVSDVKDFQIVPYKKLVNYPGRTIELTEFGKQMLKKQRDELVNALAAANTKSNKDIVITTYRGPQATLKQLNDISTTTTT